MTKILPFPTSEDVRRFQDLYEKDAGVYLSDSDALCIAAALVRYVYLIDHLEITPAKDANTDSVSNQKAPVS